MTRLQWETINSYRQEAKYLAVTIGFGIMPDKIFDYNYKNTDILLSYLE